MRAPAAVLAPVNLEPAGKIGSRRLREPRAAPHSGHARWRADPIWYAWHIGAMLAAVRIN